MNTPLPPPLRLGLVGLRFGAGLAQRQIFNDPENQKYVKVVKVCDRIPEKADAYAEKNGIPACYDIEELLRDPEIDAIMLMIPPAGRAALIRKCIDAGKHVLTTKPFELDPEAALEVLKYAREKNVIVHLNSPAPMPSCDLKQIREWQKKYSKTKPTTFIQFNLTMTESICLKNQLKMKKNAPMKTLNQIQINNQKVNQ